MSLDLLTNPFVIGYIVVIVLLYLAGSGLKHMSQEAAMRRKRRSRDDEPCRRASMSNGRKASKPYQVYADWDADEAVWTAMSAEVTGLVVKAPTIERLGEQLSSVLPASLKALGITPVSGQVAIELVARRLLVIPS